MRRATGTVMAISLSALAIAAVGAFRKTLYNTLVFLRRHPRNRTTAAAHQLNIDPHINCTLQYWFFFF